jgi:excisionase family DNA binding protein
VRLLTVKQAAEQSGLSERTIRRRCRSGRLTAIAYGSAKRPNWRIEPDALTHVQPAPDLPRPIRRIRRQRSVPSLEIAALLTKY